LEVEPELNVEISLKVTNAQAWVLWNSKPNGHTNDGDQCNISNYRT